MQRMLYDHNVVKLEIKDKRKFGENSDNIEIRQHTLK